MPNVQRPAKPGEFTGWHMLAIMVAFFGVIVSVNMTMAVFAGRTWTGLVVKNSYVASQNFNEEIAAAKAQKARGWQSTLTYRDGVISFKLEDRDRQPIIYDDLTLFFGRPAFEQSDGSVKLRHVGGGRYRAEHALAAGTWALKVVGANGNLAYRRDSRLFVRAGSNTGNEL